MENQEIVESFENRYKYAKKVFNAGLISTLLFGILELALIQLEISTTAQSISRIIFIGQIALTTAIVSSIIEILRPAIAETSYSRIRGNKPGYIVIGLFFGINSVTSSLTAINSSGIAMIIAATTSILFILTAVELFRKPERGVKIGFGVSTLLLGIMVLSLYHQPEAFNMAIAQIGAVLMAYFYPVIDLN